MPASRTWPKLLETSCNITANNAVNVGHYNSSLPLKTTSGVASFSSKFCISFQTGKIMINKVFCSYSLNLIMFKMKIKKIPSDMVCNNTAERRWTSLAYKIKWSRIWEFGTPYDVIFKEKKEIKCNLPKLNQWCTDREKRTHYY